MLEEQRLVEARRITKRVVSEQAFRLYNGPLMGQAYYLALAISIVANEVLLALFLQGYTPEEMLELDTTVLTPTTLDGLRGAGYCM